MKKININKIIIFLSSIFFIIGTSLIVVNIIYNKDEKIYNYEITKDSNNEVYLIDNDFYENNILNKNNKYDYYASNSIDKIKINFNYKFNANKKTIINYKYNIKAEIVSTIDSENKLIWNKVYTLKKDTINKVNSNNFNIIDSINIDYNFYNYYAKSYDRTFKIKTNPILKIYLNVTFGTKYNKDYKDKIEIDIPLNYTYTTITNNYKKDTINKIDNNKYNYTNTIIGSILILLSVILVTIIIFNKNKLNKDIKNLKSKIKGYKEIIVIIKKPIDTNNLNHISVKSFDDLIQIAVINNKNIMCYENKIFYVILDNYLYSFIVTI